MSETAGESATGRAAATGRTNGRVAAAHRLEHPRLPFALAGLATLLVAPSLVLGFHLDDYVHHYLFSGLPGSDLLLHAYESPFGIANGDRATNHWQIEAGYAPWWTYPDLLISLFRPLSEFTHRIDAWLWPSHALLQHLHSLTWHAALVAVAALLFRGIAGAGTIGGLAALLYAVDHTHGFAVGWIANRNALVSACLGLAALYAHQRWRTNASLRAAIAAPVLFAGALLAGEGAIAIAGYLFAHALFLDRAALSKRAAALVPTGVVIVGWRVLYTLFDRGAHGSGLYLDPLRDPGRFLVAAVERIPLLFLGEVGLPPAEVALFAPPALAHAIWLVALAILVLFAVSAAPLLRVDRTARFWMTGAALALVPACTTHPNNRLLFFVGIGVLGVLSQLWHAVLRGTAWGPGTGPLRPFARALIAGSTGFHLFVSPLLLPLSACSIALTSSVERSVRSLWSAEDLANRDLVLVTAPDHFVVKLVPVLGALEGRAGPRRLRALSFGAVPLTVERVDARTLEITYAGGILDHPLLELYRARDLPMSIGTEVVLDGVAIEVLETTPDGRPSRVRFGFDTALDDDRFRWRYWRDDGYASFTVPAVGSRVTLGAARLPLGR